MASWWRRSAGLLRAPFQEVAFAVRSRVRWSRGVAVLRDEPKDGLFEWLPPPERAAAAARADALVAAFDLGALAAASTRLVLCENLALLDRLAAAARDLEVPASPDGVVRALDVGSGCFQYATALQRWLARHGGGRPRRVELRGIEIDGFGVYRDGHSRADHARAHAALAGPGVTYEVADFTRLAVGPCDVLTMLFPFLSAHALLQWGAPLSQLRPRRVLRAAVAALRPGGLLIVQNQTASEFARLRALLAGQPVTLVRQGAAATDLVPYAERTRGRVASIWRRNTLPDRPPGR